MPFFFPHILLQTTCLLFLLCSNTTFSQSSKHRPFYIKADIRAIKLNNTGVGLSYQDTFGFKKIAGKQVGNFYEFSGQIDEPKIAKFKLIVIGDTLYPNMYFRDFVLEPGANYELIAPSDTFSNSKVSGSSINLDYEAYKRQLDHRLTKIGSLQNALESAEKNQAPATVTDSLKSLFDKFNADTKDFYASYALAHTDKWIGLYAIADLLRPPVPMAEKAAYVFSKLSDNLRNTFKASQLKKKIDLLVSTSIGRVPPDFSQPDVNGKMVSLSSFRGRYVLLDFWASWCPPCRKENPKLVKLYDAYKGNHFEIVGVSYDHEKNDWIKAIKDDKITWPQLSELKQPNLLVSLYGVQFVPQNMLLDPNGVVIGKNMSSEDIELLLSKKGLKKYETGN